MKLFILRPDQTDTIDLDPGRPISIRNGVLTFSKSGSTLATTIDLDLAFQRGGEFLLIAQDPAATTKRRSLLFSKKTRTGGKPKAGGKKKAPRTKGDQAEAKA